ncbi:uncharacterized protein KQ657_001410 [Scheffersomyces spartinae]|uniref:CFEM domain-containing protein n=1 Tax=Scheffersomyces spartinae TaxID=45513 RepID=A0A9P7V7G7_9ASCO|nr:uncharacterized protein KQ657_001410 [Scheffersomyces spartinae]KAG7192630.1 hypothetical protein KQ657_001410 [Scheffersomyces spartinae]
MADNYATYPSVARSASINGFADKIYADLPSCAQPCVKKSTGSTPCPYWDTGCLCVISSFASAVAECIAENCAGSEVDTATSLAIGICSSAGVANPYWYIGGAMTTALEAAADKAAETTTESTATATETSATEQAVETLSSAEATKDEITGATSSAAASSAATSYAATSSVAVSSTIVSSSHGITSASDVASSQASSSLIASSSQANSSAFAYTIGENSAGNTKKSIGVAMVLAIAAFMV